MSGLLLISNVFLTYVAILIGALNPNNLDVSVKQLFLVIRLLTRRILVMNQVFNLLYSHCLVSGMYAVLFENLIFKVKISSVAVLVTNVHIFRDEGNDCLVAVNDLWYSNCISNK